MVGTISASFDAPFTITLFLGVMYLSERNVTVSDLVSLCCGRSLSDLRRRAVVSLESDMGLLVEGSASSSD